MQKKSILAHLIICIFFISCIGGVKTGTLKINDSKSDELKHLGEGLYLKVPNFYFKADTYNGFQAPNYESSISVDMVYEPISKLKKIYDKKNLIKLRQTLKELRPVQYMNTDSSFFVVVENHRKQVMNYLLFIKTQQTTFRVKAFCQTRFKNKYDPIIKGMYERIHIGEKIEEEELYTLAQLVDLETAIYTKDGAYPTHSIDSAYLRIKSIEGIEGLNIKDFMKNELSKHVETEFAAFNQTELLNGAFYTYQVRRGNKKAFVNLLVDQEDNGQMITCYGNEKLDIDASLKYVKNATLDYTFK